MEIDARGASSGGSEKTTKTGAELNIPVHPVLQRLLAHWEAAGWEEFIGRKPSPEDLILPRQDGQHRTVWATNERFQADLTMLGIPRQRQYETRSTFRNLALRAGASEFHLNLITHPKPKQASDFYTRLDMQWEEMCRAVQAIDRDAWERPRSPDSQLQERVEMCPLVDPSFDPRSSSATQATPCDSGPDEAASCEHHQVDRGGALGDHAAPAECSLQRHAATVGCSDVPAEAARVPDAR
jgi:hypothetical protein